MRTKTIFLSLVFFIALLPLINAMTIVSSCQDLTVENKTYTLDDNLNASGTCININASGITLYCPTSPAYVITGDGSGNGINVNNVANVTIENCIISNFTNGIYTSSSPNIKLINNVITYSSQQGIYLTASSGYSNLTYNNVSNNNFGIRMDSSPYCIIDSNNVYNNSQFGILDWLSGHETLINNQINYNGNLGANLAGSSNNVVVNNTANFNVNGFGSYFGTNNLFENNTVDNNSNGFFIWYASGTINNNRAYGNNESGVYMTHSPNNLISNNLLSNNTYGIQLDSSNFNNVSNNIIDSSIDTGISLINEAINNNIINNNITSSPNGILANGNNSYYSGNVISLTNNAIMSAGSYQATFSNNVIYSNNYGIYLVGSQSNTVVSNNVYSNNHGLILSYGSSYNSVFNNFVSNNTEGLYNYEFSSYNSFYNNTATNNTYGMFVDYDSNGLNISNNQFTLNSVGMMVGGNSGIISYNNISSNLGVGIGYSGNNYTISQNYFNGNPDGDVSSSPSSYWNLVGINTTVVHSNSVINASSDGYIETDYYLSQGIASANTTDNPSLDVATSVIMYGLPFSTTPIIFYRNGFWTNPNDIYMGSDCVLSGICSITSYNPSTGELDFTTSQFSSFAPATVPSISFVSPTPVDGSTQGQDYVYINITSSDNISALLEWNGINETMSGLEINKTGLVSGTYYYKVYGNNSLGLWSSTETRSVTVDLTPPVISSVNAIPSTTSVIISWLTNEQANETVNYGTDVSFLPSFKISSSFGTSHVMILNGLSLNTTYYFNITACDVYGNCNIAGIFSFTTLYDNTPPTITQIGPAGTVMSRSTAIVLQTDEVAICKFGRSSSIDFANMTLFDTTNSTLHTKSFSTPTEGTFVYFIKCSDGAGNIGTLVAHYTVDFPSSGVQPVSVYTVQPVSISSGLLNIYNTIINNSQNTQQMLINDTVNLAQQNNTPVKLTLWDKIMQELCGFFNHLFGNI